jgi:hypothetical protein
MGPTYWMPSDPYKDHHPIFNRSEIATIHFKMSPDNLFQLRDPMFITNNDTYLEADMFFVSGDVRELVPKIGIKAKGILVAPQPPSSTSNPN